MENNLQRKAKMILAGLAAVPAVGAANDSQSVQVSRYCSPYSDNCNIEQQAQEEVVSHSGLNEHELQEARRLVTELNSLDVVTATDLKLDKARGIPYRYNMPDSRDLERVRSKNLDRLGKLRAMIEAAK